MSDQQNQEREEREEQIEDLDPSQEQADEVRGGSSASGDPVPSEEPTLN